MDEIRAVRALVTRPREDADAFAAELERHNIVPILAPVTTIEFSDIDISDGLGRSQAVLFTSRNGVRAFCRLTSDRSKRAYAVGDATARLARESGFEEVHSAVGDGAALVRLAASKLDPASGPLFHAAGERLAVDIAGLLSDYGFRTLRYNLYRTQSVEALPPDAARAIKDGELDCVLHFSPASARAFGELVTAGGLESGLSGLTAVCLSEAVAAELKTGAWGNIRVAGKPDAGSVISLLDQIAAEMTHTPADTSSRNHDSGVKTASGPEGVEQPVSFERASSSRAATGIPSSGPRHQERPQSAFSVKPPPSDQRSRNRGLAALLSLFLLTVVLVSSYFLLSSWRGRLAEDTTQAIGALQQQLENTRKEDLVALRRDITTLSERTGQLEAQTGSANDLSSPVAEKLAALEGRIRQLSEADRGGLSEKEGAALRQRVAKAEDAMRGMETGLADRLMLIETTVSALTDDSVDSPGLASVSDRISRAERDLKTVQDILSSLQTREDGANVRRDRAISELTETIGGLRAAITGLEADIEKLRTSVTIDSATRTRLFAAQLAATLTGSGPFSEELSGLRAALPEGHEMNRLIEDLEPYARSGVPTGHDLLARLPGVLDAISSTSETPPGGNPESWLERAADRFTDIVKVKRVNDGTIDLVVNRTRAAAGNGELIGAVNALSSLPEEAAKVAAPWLEEARSRLRVQDAIRIFVQNSGPTGIDP